MFMSTNDDVDVGASRYLFIFSHRQMRQSHDHFSAPIVNLRDHLFRCVAWIAKLDVVARSGGDFGFGQDKSEDADLNAAKFADDIRIYPTERLAGGGIDHICRDPLKTRFLDSLHQ